MPRGGVTGGTGLFFQVGRLRFGSPDLPRERAQSLAQCAVGIPAVIPGGRDEGEERVAELKEQLTAAGANLARVAIADFDGLRGVMALVDLAKGDEIVSAAPDPSH